MELAVIGILIVLIVLVTCLLHNANSRAKKWENKCRAIQDEYYNMRDTNRANELEVNRLYRQIGDLRWKISGLEEKLELERNYNRKANDSYINRNKGWKEEIKNLKKSKPISRSKAVQYITQHSNFTPTQMNNQSTDNLLDYYWYLYLMNTTITEDSKSSTNSDNNTVSDDKTEFVRVEGILYDSNKVNQNMNNYTVSDEHGQITSIPNSVYSEKLFNDGKTTTKHDESSKSSDSSYSDDSCGSSSSHYSGGSFSSSGSSSSGWGSSNHSSSGSYDSGSSDSWSSSDSSSCDSGGGDW